MITFMRVDDRIIHGQIITRWSKEYPCDGIIAVNDKAATTPVLAQSFKASTDKGFDPGIKTVIIGPCNDRPGAVKLGQNQSITQEEADALEAISKKGYDIEFALVKESSIGEWPKFRSKFGY